MFKYMSRYLTHRKAIRVLLAGSAALIAAGFIFVLVSPPPVAGEQTHFWRQSDYDDFQKGMSVGLALRNDGKIVLAPKFAPFADSNLAYLRAVRMDSHGNV